jgi:hypothetical protein
MERAAPAVVAEAEVIITQTVVGIEAPAMYPGEAWTPVDPEPVAAEVIEVIPEMIPEVEWQELPAEGPPRPAVIEENTLNADEMERIRDAMLRAEMRNRAVEAPWSAEDFGTIVGPTPPRRTTPTVPSSLARAIAEDREP